MVDYYWRLISTAFTTSLDIAQAVVFILIIAVGLLLYFHPGAKMPLEVNGWQAAAIVLGTIIVIRIVLAPFWLDQESQEKLKSSRAELKIAKSDVPKLRGAIDQIMWGGRAIGFRADNSSMDMGPSPFVLIATISNVGNKPTAAKDWRMAVEQRGKLYDVTLEVVPGTMSFTVNDVHITYFKEDALYLRGAKAINPGEMIQGILYGQVRNAERNQFVPGTFEVVLKFRDIIDQEYEVRLQPEDGKNLNFLPGIRQEFK
jgi:hypothetical protein